MWEISQKRSFLKITPIAASQNQDTIKFFFIKSSGLSFTAKDFQTVYPPAHYRDAGQHAQMKSRQRVLLSPF